MQYAAWAAAGQGVDRHLLGLKKLLREGEPVPEIYTDEAFGKTNHWELSTSNLSSPWLDGWGYGEGVLSFLKGLIYYMSLPAPLLMNIYSLNAYSFVCSCP